MDILVTWSDGNHGTSDWNYVTLHDAYMRKHRRDDLRIPCPKCKAWIEMDATRCIDPHCFTFIRYGCTDASCCLQYCITCSAPATHSYEYYTQDDEDVTIKYIKPLCATHIGIYMHRISYDSRTDDIAETCIDCPDWRTCYGWDIDGCNNYRLEAMADGII